MDVRSLLGLAVLACLALASAGFNVVEKSGEIPFFDIKIAYKLFDVENPGAEQDARMNPTAIFLHGAKYASDFWASLGTLKSVAESGVRAMAIDLPGYGKTPALPYSDNNMRSELLKTVIEAAWPKVNSTIILISPSASGRYSIPFLDRYGTMVASFVAVAPIGVKDWGGPWEDVHKRVRGRGRQERLREDVSKKVCALAVYGAQDPMAPDAERLIRLFGHSWKVIIPGAGHRSYEDKPISFHKVLMAFLKKCRRGPNGDHMVEGDQDLTRAIKEAEKDGSL